MESIRKCIQQLNPKTVLNVNYTRHKCVWFLCLQYNVPANRPSLEGSTAPSMKGVCSPWGKPRDLIGWGRGKAPMNVCGVTAARSRDCVSSYRVYFLSGCSHGISSSHSLSAHGGIWEGAYGEGRGRHKMRSKQQSLALVLWYFIMEVWVGLYWSSGMGGGHLANLWCHSVA